MQTKMKNRKQSVLLNNHYWFTKGLQNDIRIFLMKPCTGIHYLCYVILMFPAQQVVNWIVSNNVPSSQARWDFNLLL